MTANPDVTVPVLIVGGGPVGLCGALLVGREGVPTLLVEKAHGASAHPKAMGLNIRTMELFRSWGIADLIQSVGSPYPQEGLTLIVESLAGREFKRSAPYGGDGEAAEDPLAGITPASWWRCPQLELEPILKQAATPSCEIRYGHELTALEQDDDGVTATIADHSVGTTYTVRAEYLVAADGSASTVRRMLDIPLRGDEALSRYVNIYFRADLDKVLGDRRFVKCVIKNDKVTGVLLPVDDVDRWLLHPAVSAEIPEERLDETWARGIIQAAIGTGTIEPEVLGAQVYWTAASVAERYRVGRVLLVGDSAHTMPPSGAFGMNTGIQDVHNLGWKLTAVINGWASPALLDSYEDERLPVGEATVWEAAGQHGNRAGEGSKRERRRDGDLPVALGYAYRSAAIAGPAAPLDDVIPDEMPRAVEIGRRAPHLWLRRGDERFSLIDLFDRHYTLIAGPQGHRWLSAARELADGHQIPITGLALAPAGDLIDEDGRWDEVYGLGAEGAVLVRPDGFVAWLNSGTNEVTQLGAVLADTLGLLRVRR